MVIVSSSFCFLSLFFLLKNMTTSARDVFFLCVDFSLVLCSEAQCGCDDAETRAVLQDFYNSTQGAQWTNNFGWNTEIPVFFWHGVACLAGSVASIIIPDNTLKGTLPDSLGRLSLINFIDLRNNGLTGTLPSAWTAMTFLASIVLFNNQLSGTLPAHTTYQHTSLLLLLT